MTPPEKNTDKPSNSVSSSKNPPAQSVSAKADINKPASGNKSSAKACQYTNNKLQLTGNGVSIIILTKDSPDHLDNLLSSFFATNTHKPVELIIIDHSSPDTADNTSKTVSRYISRGFVRLIRRGKNYTFSESCNFGASKTKHPFLLFLNDDIIYTEDVLGKAVETLEKDQHIGAVGVRLDDVSQEAGDRSQETAKKEQGIQHLGVEFKWNEKRGYHQPEQIRHPSLKAYLSGCDQQPEKIRADSCRFVDKISSFCPAVTAAFFLVRKSDFNALGGFSVEYNYGLEDIDFCLRLGRDLNKKCFCINEMGLQHVEGATRKDLYKAKSEVIEKNHEVFKGKWDGYIRNNFIQAKQAKAPQSLPNNTDNSASEALRILFVLPQTIEGNNGYQVQLLARMLASQGATCTIAVPDSTSLPPHSSLLTPHSFISYSSLLTPDSSLSYDIIHAWTPREIVREFTEKLLAKHKCPLIIHLEDNEEYLTEVAVGKPWADLAQMPQAELDKIVPKNRFHPIKGRKFLSQAQGLSMVIEALNRFNPNGLPYQILPPMVDERLFYPRPINRELRQKHNIPNDTTVLVYTGNIHAGNKDEVYELYKAVDLLNQQGHPTVLLRTGLDNKNIDMKSWPRKHEIHLGWVQREELPEIMAAADIFVQPGKPGPFNDERIPCKLPECFAMGRPVILPKTNLGLKVEHGKEGYVLDAVNAEDISRAVLEIRKDEKLDHKLSDKGIDFYLDQCSALYPRDMSIYSALSLRD